MSNSTRNVPSKSRRVPTTARDLPVVLGNGPSAGGPAQASKESDAYDRALSSEDRVRLAMAKKKERDAKLRAEKKARLAREWAKTPQGKASKAATAERMRHKARTAAAKLGIVPGESRRAVPLGVVSAFNDWSDQQELLSGARPNVTLPKSNGRSERSAPHRPSIDDPVAEEEHDGSIDG